jgi:hypothetical protein
MESQDRETLGNTLLSVFYGVQKGDSALGTGSLPFCFCLLSDGLQGRPKTDEPSPSLSCRHEHDNAPGGR